LRKSGTPSRGHRARCGSSGRPGGEHDKNPEGFFTALRELVARDIDFRLSVLGEQFDDAPAIFAEARDEFAGRIDRFGYLPSRRDYLDVLARSDVFVSTAQHEFFGISAVEAAAVGTLPVLPRRLAYPEIFDLAGDGACFFYDGSTSDLTARLVGLSERLMRGDELETERQVACRIASAFEPARRAAAMDDAIEQLAGAP
jgi:glycosyltransferase involved in cell wall biosynthesis